MKKKMKNLRLNIYIVFFSSFLLFSNSLAFAQKGVPLSISKDFTVPELSREKINKKIQKFIKNLENSVIVNEDEKTGTYELRCAMPYINDVVLEQEIMNINAALRTKGEVYFKLKITVKEGGYKITCSNFYHKAFKSRYGEISFGQILTSEKPPIDNCFENVKWCNAVWNNIKEKINKHCIKLFQSSKDEIS